MADPEIDAMQLLDMLRSIKPKPKPVTPEVREWWEKTALPTLKAQALSELHRNDEFKPRLVGMMKGGGMGIVDIAKATGGVFGNSRSKNATAFVHQIAALIPSTYASVFCVEAWALRTNTKGELDRQADKYPNLGDHPDRYEVVMFQMLHYEREDNSMQQLATMIEVIKVLGANRSREAWRGTTLGEETTTDPMEHSELRMTGRFIFADGEWEVGPPKDDKK
jgi:hypothetical protein